MTFEQKIVEMLIGNGLFADQAREIIDLAKLDRSLVSMEKRWSEDVADFPDTVLVGAWLSVQDVALEWIDEHCPLAWFRPLFSQGVTWIAQEEN